MKESILRVVVFAMGIALGVGGTLIAVSLEEPTPPYMAPPCQAAPAWSVWFSPNGGVTSAIVHQVGKATKTIDIQAYSFTSHEITAALIAAHNRGVRVRIIIDKPSSMGKGCTVHECAKAGIPVWTDSVHKIAHSKVFIYDGEVVGTGSFNFSEAAETGNSENHIIIRDKKLAEIYTRTWESHLSHSEPLGKIQAADGLGSASCSKQPDLLGRPACLASILRNPSAALNGTSGKTCSRVAIDQLISASAIGVAEESLSVSAGELLSRISLRTWGRSLDRDTNLTGIQTTTATTNQATAAGQHAPKTTATSERTTYLPMMESRCAYKIGPSLKDSKQIRSLRDSVVGGQSKKHCADQWDTGNQSRKHSRSHAVTAANRLSVQNGRIATSVRPHVARHPKRFWSLAKSVASHSSKGCAGPGQRNVSVAVLVMASTEAERSAAQITHATRHTRSR